MELSRKLVDKMADAHQQLLGTKPAAKALSPLGKGNHPEINEPKPLDGDGTQKHQLLVSTAQRAISISHFGASTAAMMAPGLRAQLHHGHLNHVKCICGCLRKAKGAEIVACADEPGCSEAPTKERDWPSSACGSVAVLCTKHKDTMKLAWM